MNIWENFSKPIFVLAPMDDVTDTVFRRIIANLAPPDIFFTEFVNVDGLVSPGRPNMLHRLVFTHEETPLIAQIWGKDPDNYYKVARQIADGTLAKEANSAGELNYAGVDINMGCPIKAVVNNGCCSALIENRDLASAIISAVKAGIHDAGTDNDLPVSVKTRIGFNEIDMNWLEFLLRQNIDALIIHGRTRRQMSDVPADWNAIGQTRKLRDAMQLKTKIIGNGDVMSKKQGLSLANKHQLDGIMIARGVFSDPLVFAGNDDWSGYTPIQKLKLYRRQIKLFETAWPNGERNLHTLNRFCKVYVNNFDGAKEIREKLMAARTASELEEIIEKQRQALAINT